MSVAMFVNVCVVVTSSELTDAHSRKSSRSVVQFRSMGRHQLIPTANTVANEARVKMIVACNPRWEMFALV